MTPDPAKTGVTLLCIPTCDKNTTSKIKLIMKKLDIFITS